MYPINNGPLVTLIYSGIRGNEWAKVHLVLQQVTGKI